MPYYVYVLRNEKGKQYIGQTGDLEERMRFHDQGLSPYTSRHRPWRLVHTETYDTRSQAMTREHYLKTGAGRDWLKRTLDG